MVPVLATESLLGSDEGNELRSIRREITGARESLPRCRNS